MTYKLFLGPMSKNVIEAVIGLNLPLVLIPSRRQVEYDSGYTGFTTKDLFEQTRGTNVKLCRDHAGPHQGKVKDDGLLSLSEDAKYMDLIHIDPWKVATGYEDGKKRTKELIEYCLSINSKLKFEVGTEEAIFKYEPNFLDRLLFDLRSELGRNYNSIQYGVVQSGTGLDLPGRKNTGTFDKNRLEHFLQICRDNNVLSKEHNGDFLVDNFGIQKRFELGLDAINIAPELGQVESEFFIYNLLKSSTPLFKKLVDICSEDKSRWSKWIVGKRTLSDIEIILTAGHYQFNSLSFINGIKSYFPYSDFEIQELIKTLIKKMFIQAYGSETKDYNL